MDTYKSARDMLGDESGTSRMSLALTWGLVSARQLVAQIQKHYDASFELAPTSGARQNAAHYLSELVWREFYKYLLFHDPALMGTEFQQKFRGTVEWAADAEALRRFTAWICGATGYPLLDAAMRQIAETGYMHNRARMVAASVLTKNLGVDWRWGQEYFRAALVDLDEASNNGGWQWGASVGADPKPIRIFNPELQAKNYDPESTYQERWLPESYRAAPPEPIVPHALARTQALARYHLRVEPRDH
jgi:deoxyribodipyrimidine photo-lyase